MTDTAGAGTEEPQTPEAEEQALLSQKEALQSELETLGKSEKTGTSCKRIVQAVEKNAKNDIFVLKPPSGADGSGGGGAEGAAQEKSLFHASAPSSGGGGSGKGCCVVL